MNLSRPKHWKRFARSHLVQKENGTTWQYRHSRVFCLSSKKNHTVCPSHRHINTSTPIRSRTNERTTTKARKISKRRRWQANSHRAIPVYTIQCFNVNHSHNRPYTFCSLLTLHTSNSHSLLCMCLHIYFLVKMATTVFRTSAACCL